MSLVKCEHSSTSVHGCSNPGMQKNCGNGGNIEMKILCELTPTLFKGQVYLKEQKF